MLGKNSSLANSTNEVVVVLNEEYQIMVKEINDLRRENKHWKEIVNKGKIVTVETLVTDFIEFSRGKLRDIAYEAQMTEYANDTFYAIGNLLTYFNDVTRDLEKIMSSKFVDGEFVSEISGGNGDE